MTVIAQFRWHHQQRSCRTFILHWACRAYLLVRTLDSSVELIGPLEQVISANTKLAERVGFYLFVFRILMQKKEIVIRCSNCSTCVAPTVLTFSTMATVSIPSFRLCGMDGMDMCSLWLVPAAAARAPCCASVHACTSGPTFPRRTAGNFTESTIFEARSSWTLSAAKAAPKFSCTRQSPNCFWARLDKPEIVHYKGTDWRERSRRMKKTLVFVVVFLLGFISGLLYHHWTGGARDLRAYGR